MDINKDLLFAKLMLVGLFPFETSKILTSIPFGMWVLKNKFKVNNEKRIFKLLRYKVTRNNNIPRYMGIPNPLSFLTLCYLLKDNWPKIQKRFGNIENYKKVSLITVESDEKIDALVVMGSDYRKKREQERLMLEKRVGSKIFIESDISNFFPSLYTHSLCWALAGKAIAKKNKLDGKKWYNKIDKAVRNMQNQETIGLPIGPKTSFILSEIVLSQIDDKLRKYSYIRHIDDYDCYCKSKNEAEDFIKDLGSALEEYHLVINTKKTKIHESPVPLSPNWVRVLRNFSDSNIIGEYNMNKIRDYLDCAVDFSKENIDASSIKYALKGLIKKTYVDYSSYELILKYSLDLCFLSPYIIDTIDEIILLGIDEFDYRKDEVKQILKLHLNKIINEHLTYGRSDVVSLAIFLAIKYEIKLDNFSRLKKKIILVKDCIPTLMSYLYAKANKIPIDDFKKMLRNLDSDEWWLFIYELGRIENKKNSDPDMEKMRKDNISFLTKDLLNKLK